MKKEPKQCEICGEFFIPHNSLQRCCCKDVVKICPVCNEEYITRCSYDAKSTCSKLECKKQAGKVISPTERICKQCGDKFITTRKAQVYCNQEKTKVCPACGNEFKYICNNDEPTTCGDPHCAADFIKKKRRDAVAKEVRICKWCGKEFHPREIRDVYCYETHYKNCVICGRKFEFDPRRIRSEESNTCSKECKGKLMSQNHDYVKGAETQKKVLQKKYGVDNPMKIPGVVDKIVATNREKFGADWYTQTDEYKKKVNRSNQEKYGVDWYLESEEALEKRTATNLEKYGVENVFQVAEIQEQIRKTNIEKYGFEHPAESPEVIEATKQKYLEKYGVEHPMMLPEFQEKAKRTNIEKFGRVAYTQQHIENIQQWYEFIDNPREYIRSHYDSPPRTKELAADLGVGPDTIDTHLGRNDAFDCVRRAKSLMEEELISTIKSIDEEIRVVSNTRSIVEHGEVDLYLPDYNFAIECDPTCTHNSSVSDPWGGEPKHRKYHMNKTDSCEAKGIFLLHIFGYDWSHKKDVILSMIRNRLGKCENVIYARKCNIIEVSGGEAIKFLNMNHRQGEANSKVRLGLEYNGELVSLMTFGHMRGTIGTGDENLENCWELVRFCSKLNTSVVGAASKLMNHFVKTFNPERIRSFSDRAHTSGNLYPTLGFKEIRRSDPGYVWVSVVSDKAYHRANSQKQNLKKFLKDDSIDLNKTEIAIMVEHGFVQVFDSGTITWEWCHE